MVTALVLETGCLQFNRLDVFIAFRWTLLRLAYNKNRHIYDSLAKARHGYDVAMNVSQANDAEYPVIFFVRLTR